MPRKESSRSSFQKPQQEQVAEEAAEEEGEETERAQQQREIQTKANPAGKEIPMQGGAAGHDRIVGNREQSARSTTEEGGPAMMAEAAS